MSTVTVYRSADSRDAASRSISVCAVEKFSVPWQWKALRIAPTTVRDIAVLRFVCGTALTQCVPRDASFAEAAHGHILKPLTLEELGGIYVPDGFPTGIVLLVGAKRWARRLCPCQFALVWSAVVRSCNAKNSCTGSPYGTTAPHSTCKYNPAAGTSIWAVQLFASAWKCAS